MSTSSPTTPDLNDLQAAMDAILRKQENTPAAPAQSVLVPTSDPEQANPSAPSTEQAPLPESAAAPVFELPGATAWTMTRKDGAVLIQRRGLPEPVTDEQHQTLIDLLGSLQGAAMVGAKRLTGDNQSMVSIGERVIHPKGYHSLGAAFVEWAHRFVVEIDSVAGGLVAVDEQAFDACDGEALLHGELGMLRLGLAIRRDHGRVFGVPHVMVVDPWMPKPGPAEDDAFVEQFGFDWRAADLDEVTRQHAGTGLLWDVALHAPTIGFEKYERREALCWKAYGQTDVFRKRADHIGSLMHKYCPSGLLVDVGCGDGLFDHLAAKRGVAVLGLDPEPAGVKLCQSLTDNTPYPGPRPRFQEGTGTDIPVGDNEASCVTLFDVIEHLPNPVRVLKEIARVLAPGGIFLCITPEGDYGRNSDPAYHLFEYTANELKTQIDAIPGLDVFEQGRIGGVYRDLVAVARKSA